MFSRILASATFVAVLGLNASFEASAAGQKFDPPVKVTVGGFFKFIAGLVHNRSENKDKDLGRIYDANNNVIKEIPYKRRSGDFLMDADFIATAEGSMEEGFVYGAELRLEADPANYHRRERPFRISRLKGQPDIEGTIVETTNAGKANVVNADKVFMYFGKENWGRFEAGAVEGVADGLAYYAPASFGTGGIDGLYQDFLNGELVDTAYKPRNSFRSLKVNYMTPRIDGFQAGISFAPDMNRKGRYTERNRLAFADPGTKKLDDWNFGEVVEYGVNYVNTFDGVGLFLSATGAHGQAYKYPNRNYNDLNSYGFGANLVFSGFTIGGGWTNNGRSGYFKGTQMIPRLSNGKEQSWNIGLQYETGPVVVGTNYVHMKTAGNTAELGMSKADVVSGGATYKVASGLSVFTELTATHRKLKRSENGELLRAKRDHRSLALIGTKVDW